MAAVSQERLNATQQARQRARIQRRRMALIAIVALVLLTVVAVAVLRLRGEVAGDGAAVASPVASTSLDLGAMPPDRVVATAGPVEIHLPVDRSRVRQTLFRPIDDAAAAEMKPDGTWKHVVWTSSGTGPRTAGMDIAAPAGTIVFAPVSGTVTGVGDYVVAGRTAGYQIDISPDAASDVVVRVRHIVEVLPDRNAQPLCKTAGVERPHVGQVLVAGVTCIGQVRDVQDLVDVARPLIAKYVSDGGNHVHVEVVRVGT